MHYKRWMHARRDEKQVVEKGAQNEVCVSEELLFQEARHRQDNSHKHGRSNALQKTEQSAHRGRISVAIIAGFWKILPNFADHELVFGLFDLQSLEALTNQAFFDCPL